MGHEFKSCWFPKVAPGHSHLSFNTSLSLSLYQMFQCETPCTDRMTIHAMWKAKACEQTKNEWKCVNQCKSAISCLSRLQGQLQSCCTILVPLLHAGTWNQRRPFIYSNDSNVHLPGHCLFHQKNQPMVLNAFVKQKYAKHVLFRAVVRCLLAARTARVPHGLLPLLETKQSSLEKAACWALTNNFVVWNNWDGQKSL